jgi:hypothetical protein
MEVPARSETTIDKGVLEDEGKSIGLHFVADFQKRMEQRKIVWHRKSDYHRRRPPLDTRCCVFA